MFNTLRSRLTLIFIGLAVGPLILTNIIIGPRNVATFEQQSLVLQHQIATTVGSEVRAFIQERVGELVDLNDVYGLGLRDFKEQQTILDTMLLHQQVYQEITLLNADGETQLKLSRSGSDTNNNLENRAEDEVFLFPATYGQTYFSPVRFDETIREPLVTIAVPMVNLRTQEVVSVLVADLRFRAIWNLLADMELFTQGEVYVTDSAGQVIAHKNPSLVLQGATVNLPQKDGRAIGILGTEVIIARDILQFGNQEFIVVAEQPLSDAFKAAVDSRRVTVAVTAAMLIVAILLVVFTTRQIVKPIESLATSAQAISRGDFSRQVQVSNRDEVYKLAKAFNSMSAQLQQTLAGLELEIAERKQAEEQIRLSLREKEILLQEIHHRVKNNLAIVSSLLDFQSETVESEPARAAFQESRHRIRAMARIHEHLYRAPDLARVNMAEYIRGVVDYLSMSYGAHNTALQVDVSDVVLDIDQAMPCGLIINELVSNTLKYAFPPDWERLENNTVCVALRLDDSRCNLVVSDNGIGLPADFDFEKQEMLGLKLVNLLTRQLKGTLNVDREGGTTFSLTFAIPDRKEPERW